MSTGTEHQSDNRKDDASEGIAYLDQALWSQLQNPVDIDAFGSAWLALLAQNIRGVRSGVLVLIDGVDRQLRPVASWPRGWTPTAPVISAAEAAIAERGGVARAAQLEESGASPDRCQLSYPILIDGTPAGVVALELDIRPRREITLALRQMQWGAAWVEKALRERSVAGTKNDLARLKSALELFSATLDTHGVEEAASAFATELATSLGCNRVSVGAHNGRAMSVIALSHSAQFDKRMNLIHGLTRLMEEAADQNAAIVLPQDAGGVFVIREHEEFAKRNDDQAIFSAPFQINDQRTGVLTLERDGGKPFEEDEVELVMAVTALAGPVFDDRLTIEKPIISKVADWGREEVRKLTGPEDSARKIFMTVTAAILLFCVFATGTYRVAADTRLEGAVRRTVVAPIDGYVGESDIRPGDPIGEGAMLARLETSDLRMERLHWLGEKRKSSLEYAKAISSRDRAALGVLNAQIEQADARLALIDLQIERSQLKSPFDGVVISGDLTQRIGGSVARGEVLYEIAPLNDYRVIIEIDERDIDFVERGQEGRLILSSMPGQPVPIVVRSVTPVSTAQGGSNFFRVEADLGDGADKDRLRPGMEGVAKIEIGRRRLVWIWTHDMLNWVRMTLWRWMP